MISEASSTSLNMSTAIPSIRITPLRLRCAVASFGDQHAFGGVLVEVAEERVAAGLQWPHENSDGRLCRHDLLPVELGAFEFFGRRVLVLDLQLDLLPRGHHQLGWLE